MTVEEALGEVRDLYERKNSDYRGSQKKSTAEEMFDEYGHEYFTMMISQKAKRIRAVASSEGSVNFESISDSYRDIIAYAAIALTLIEKDR